MLNIWHVSPVLVVYLLLLYIPDFKDRLEISMTSSLVPVPFQRSVMKIANFDVSILCPPSRWCQGVTPFHLRKRNDFPCDGALAPGFRLMKYRPRQVLTWASAPAATSRQATSVLSNVPAWSKCADLMFRALGRKFRARGTPLNCVRE